MTISYKKPSSNPLQTVLGVDATEFTDFPVTNLSPASAPAAPGNFRATPGVAAGSISRTWDEA